MLNRAKHLFVNFMRRMYLSVTGQKVLRLLLKIAPVRALAFTILENVKTPANRRRFIEAIQTIIKEDELQLVFAQHAKERHLAMPQNINKLDIAALSALMSGDRDLINSTLYSDAADSIVAKDPLLTSIPGARVSFGHELENYREVVAEARRITNVNPGILRARLDYLKSAYAAGKVLSTRDAIEFVGRQYMLFDDHPGEATDREIERVIEVISQAVLHTLNDKHNYYELKHERAPKIGVFFLSSTQALGHAILDPFHFLALNRNRFDKIYFIGPPKTSYAAAPRACLQIVEQYGDYIETHSDLLLNLSWMSLGEHQIGSYTLVIDHYWSLLREVYHRSIDKKDEFQHNHWHLKLPNYFNTIGELFCRKHEIDLSQPIIVLHARDNAYHAIARQAFRNSSIFTYKETILHLLDKGFQVVRLGDKKMPSLELSRKGYFELPFLDGYACELDPFFINKAQFMIGCQSGPCAFGRALGTPMLSINAVLHYTLLPSSIEMACFKRYFRGQGSIRDELTISEALAAGADHFDNTYHFNKAGIEVESSSAEEILAATKDMMVWVNNPKLPATKSQKAFQDQSKRHAKALSNQRETLDTPIADYVGIALPGYRISPTVDNMRSEN